MTCHRIHGGIICVSHWGRMRLGNRYILVDFHEYCGPSFFWNSDMTKIYEPADENDPIWPVFEAWITKFRKQKAEAKRIADYRQIDPDAVCEPLYARKEKV